MCTAFVVERDEFLVANNMDIPISGGMIFSNLRDNNKTALIDPGLEPLSWTSKYGSVSLSLCGKEFPCSGINEKGLTVIQLTLPETVYPVFKNKPYVSDLQLIQFLLDTEQTVQNAIKRMKEVSIPRKGSALHYFICDKYGGSAVVEFINGSIICYTGEKLPIKVLCNSQYDESLECILSDTRLSPEVNQYKKDSFERFAKAARGLGEISLDTDLFFFSSELLNKVARDDTLWSVIFYPGQSKLKIRMKTWGGYLEVDLLSIDFSNGTTSKAIDVQRVSENGLPEIQDYSSELNFRLVRDFYENPLIKAFLGVSMPEDTLHYISMYPEINCFAAPL